MDCPVCKAPGICICSPSDDSDQTAPTADPAKRDDGWEWAVVEVMGHRSHAGRIREEERFGAKMLRVDVPTDGDRAKGWMTHLCSANAIFSLRYSDEATIMNANKPYVSPNRLSYRDEAEEAKVVVERDENGDG